MRGCRRETVVNKSEILEKSRSEYGVVDEREKQMGYRAASVGMWVTFALVMIYGQIKIFVFGESANDIMAIAFLGAAATFFARYRYARERAALAGGIVFSFVALIWFATFILRFYGAVV